MYIIVYIYILLLKQSSNKWDTSSCVEVIPLTIPDNSWDAHPDIIRLLMKSGEVYVYPLYTHYILNLASFSTVPTQRIPMLGAVC